jgi:hypothetical protein
LGNDPKRRYPAVGNVIADGHVCIVCPARNDSVCHGAARLIERQPRGLSSLLGKARDSSVNDHLQCFLTLSSSIEPASPPDTAKSGLRGASL